MYNGYETEELVKDHIRALLEERAGQEAVGNKEAVKIIDEQLRLFGYKGAAPAKRAERRPAEAKAEKRA